MDDTSFGVYVLTYPGDFHLSAALVESIHRVSPDIPVMIIPGEGFDRSDHPFDVPIMAAPDGFWAQLGHQDRDFWAFQGPFEKFLYLDSDTICVSSLDSLAARVRRMKGDFLLVQQWVDDADWQSAVENPQHPQHDVYCARVRRVVGKGDFDLFDGDVGWYEHYPFNSGVWASNRGAIAEADIAALHERELAYYRDVLKRPFTWKADGLFQRDQGRLNYLARKLSIPTSPIHPELICLYGGDALTVTPVHVRRQELDYHVIHWTGAPRPSPSLMCRKPLFTPMSFLWRNVARGMTDDNIRQYGALREIPAYTWWRSCYEQAIGTMPLSMRMHWTWRDISRLRVLLFRWLRPRFRASLGDRWYRRLQNFKRRQDGSA